MSRQQAGRSPTVHRIATAIRWFSVPIVLLWLLIAATTNVFVPLLEDVGKAHNVALISADSPALQAMKRMGKDFGEFDSDSVAMIVLEGQQPLGPEAHQYYDTLVRKLTADTTHVQHVQDFWGDPLTAGAAQSNDGKAAYVQVNLAGNQGGSLSLQSVDAVRDIIDQTPTPPGVKTYLTGAAPLFADQLSVGSRGIGKVTIITFVVIMAMLLFIYRSVSAAVVTLLTVLVELSAARGIVSLLASSGVIGLSTFATNLVTLLVIAAGTDYAIFLIGRYHEARQYGEDRETAFYTMYHGTAHVILGSGLTVVGAVLCLSFTRLPYFKSMGPPSAIGVLVALVAALTLAPAVVTIASLFGLLEPKRAMRTRTWRRIGTAVVRWPGPILVVSIGIALIGLLALPGYKTSYDQRRYLPASAPAVAGYAAAERHFSAARLNPELVMIEADHDLRTPADMILLERVAKAIFHADGVAEVQSITRPLGTPLDHTSLGFQISAQSIGQIQNLPFQQARAGDILKQVGEIDKGIDALRQQLSLQQQANAATDEQAQAFHQTVAIAEDLRSKIANFDDFFRPVRNYFYWEPHCFDIPVCWAIRSVFDALDGLDALTDQLGNVTKSLDKLTALQPEILKLIPTQIAIQQANRQLAMTNYATNSGITAQAQDALQNASAMGQAFDAAKTDDSFYLPPDVFDNPEFQRGLRLFLSRTARPPG